MNKQVAIAINNSQAATSRKNPIAFKDDARALRKEPDERRVNQSLRDMDVSLR